MSPICRLSGSEMLVGVREVVKCRPSAGCLEVKCWLDVREAVKCQPSAGCLAVKCWLYVHEVMRFP